MKKAFKESVNIKEYVNIKVKDVPKSKWDIRKEVKLLSDEIVAFRRDFHCYPELGYKEERTASIIADRLNKLGYQVKTKVAKTGVVGFLEGGSAPALASNTKTILLRADMDALPVKEATGASYASREDGVMHACGHDGHMAILLGVAKILANNRDRFKGNVKLVFQPAEEGPGGAQAMIEAGILKSPKVDAAFGLHVWNNLPVGTIGLQSGPIMAYADEFELKLKGVGGHGASPHQTVDPIVMAAQVINAFQTIVSRKVDPLETGVVSFGVVKGGDAFNIIPSKVDLAGTVRAYSLEVRDSIRKNMEKIAKGIVSSFGGDYELQYKFGYPATINDDTCTEFVRGIIASVMRTKDAIIPSKSMGAEDMSYFLQKVPGCYFFLGSSNPEKNFTAPHHSPYFDFDEDVLPLGVEIMTRIVEEFM